MECFVIQRIFFPVRWPSKHGDAYACAEHVCSWSPLFSPVIDCLWVWCYVKVSSVDLIFDARLVDGFKLLW